MRMVSAGDVDGVFGGERAFLSGAGEGKVVDYAGSGFEFYPVSPVNCDMIERVTPCAVS